MSIENTSKPLELPVSISTAKLVEHRVPIRHPNRSNSNKNNWLAEMIGRAGLYSNVVYTMDALSAPFDDDPRGLSDTLAFA